MSKDFERVKLYISTLGCKVNQSESNAIADYLTSAGARTTDALEANVIIVNSCAVTNQAASKTRNELRSLKRDNQDALLVFMGCYVEQEEIEPDIYDLADILIGTRNKSSVYGYIKEFIEDNKNITPTPSSHRQDREFDELFGIADSDRTRAQVIIQDGCENFCTYCIIPYLRGPERSRKKEEIIEEIKKLELRGYKEIVLTGIHLGSYGNDFANSDNIASLLEEILMKTKIPRIRLSSIEPNEVSDELITLYKTNERLMPHMHIPLQSGSDSVLAKMHRKYTTSEYYDLIVKLRANIQNIAITTDLIVGFPGESDSDFSDSLKFIEKINFSQMHVFRYSKRKGTLAAEMPDQVNGLVAKERSKKIRELAKTMGKKHTSHMLQTACNVLIEQRLSNGMYLGHAENYTKVMVDNQVIKLNNIYKIKIINNFPYSVEGLML